MRQKLIALLLTVVLLLNVLPSALAAEPTVTIMMYMCGTDLQSDCVEDIKEMCAASLNGNVRILVLAGGAKKWDNKQLQARRLNLFTIENGRMSAVTDWGQGNMGDQQTLQRFVTYGWQNYRSQRMMLVMWDHGGGTMQGICADELYDNDTLLLGEIHGALRSVKAADPSFHLDLMGCDACLMAGYEMAAVAADFADYFVASEELEPWLGWYYTPWLTRLGGNPGMSTADIGRAIVEAYQQAVQKDKEAEEYTTLSVIDLSAFRTFMADMEQLAAYLAEALDNGQLATINRMVQRMYALGSFEASDGENDMYDMGGFLDICAQFAPELTASARRHLADAVVCNYASADVPSASGLSIYIPKDSASWIKSEGYFTAYAVEGLLPNYSAFVSGMTDTMNGSSYTFAASAPVSVNPSTFIAGSFGAQNYGYIPGSTFVPETPSFIAGSASSSGGSTAASGSVPSFIAGSASSGGSAASSGEASATPGTVPSFIPGTIGGQVAQAPVITESTLAFSLTLSRDAMENLSFVEGALLLDVSDEEDVMLVDMGYLRNSWIDWEKATVYSAFDGTWPTLDGQFVVLYDRSVTDLSRRSLIPVKVNGEETYLVVVFDAGSEEGRIIGHNAGVDDNGQLIRRVTPLVKGDVIIPLYTVLYCGWDELDHDDDFNEMDIEGDPIIWQEGMTVTYSSLADEEEPSDFQFAFILNDIFGDYEMSDFMDFTM